MPEGTDAPETETVDATAPPETPPVDLAAEVEKWKTHSKKNEERAKANAKAAQELEELKRKSMDETERAVAEARDAGFSEGFTKGAARLVEAEIRAAAKGRVADVDALLEGLDANAFLGDDREPNREAITSWIDRIAPEATEPTQPTPPSAPLGFPPVPDIGQGKREDAMALNGDPLFDAIKNAVGAK